jgi:mannose-1-phosphate guanylyltransferase
VPKCLVPINGRPLLDYWLELLSAGGLADVLVNLHYLPDQVRGYLATCPHPLRIATAFERDLLGTGGTLLRNRDYFRGEPVMLVHADNLSLFDVGAFVARFATRPAGVDMTMMTFLTDAPETCGIVELDAGGVVRAFHEKVPNPPGRLANAAVYILAPAVLDFIASLGKDQVDFSTEVLPKFLGRINTYENSVYHRDIGNPESLRRAEAEYPLAAARAAKAGGP